MSRASRLLQKSTRSRLWNLGQQELKLLDTTEKISYACPHSEHLFSMKYEPINFRPKFQHKHILRIKKKCAYHGKNVEFVFKEKLRIYGPALITVGPG